MQNTPHVIVIGLLVCAGRLDLLNQQLDDGVAQKRDRQPDRDLEQGFFQAAASLGDSHAVRTAEQTAQPLPLSLEDDHDDQGDGGQNLDELQCVLYGHVESFSSVSSGAIIARLRRVARVSLARRGRVATGSGNAHPRRAGRRPPANILLSSGRGSGKIRGDAGMV